MQTSLFIHWIQNTTFAGVPLWNLMLAVGVAGVAYFAMLITLRVLTGRAKV